MKNRRNMTLRVMILTTVLLSFTATASAQIQDTPTGVVVHGNVFGAGRGLDNDANAAKVGTNTTVNIEGNTQIYGNVFGGGDEGVVEGSAEVNIRETPAMP